MGRRGVILLGIICVLAAAGCGPSAGPRQPVAFAHSLHAGQYKIPCQYCHIYARRSPVSGVPPVQICMNCHRFVAADRPEIQKIAKAWQEQKPIPWVRVYTLPDFVYFTHKRHVLAELECRTCHGPVETMERIRQVPSLEMGWCLGCHKSRGVSTDCLTCHK